MPPVSVNHSWPCVWRRMSFVVLLFPSRPRLASMWLCRLQIVTFFLAALSNALRYLTVFMPSSRTDGAENVHFGQAPLITSYAMAARFGLLNVGCEPWLASFQAWNCVTHG